MSKKLLFLANKDNVLYNFRREVIMRFKELGYDIVLNCPYGKKIDYFTERGCRFIDMSIDRRGTNVFKDIALLKYYRNLLAVEKPDIVLTYTTKPSVYAGYICGRRKIPYIVNNAGLIETKGMLEFFLRQLYRIGFKHATCIMYQNSREKEYVNKILHNKVHYREIPGSGVNLQEFKYTDYPMNDDEITFNYVARIVGFKGINEFLECAKRIKKQYPNTRFMIYGDYDDESYKARINKLVEENIVEYAGILMDMKPAIAACHAVIHPSYYEGMTNVVLEHSAMGRPCIGTDIPGVKEGIDNGETGFLFPLRDIDSLERCVSNFIEMTHSEKKQLGVNARRKMENEFDRTLVINAYIEEVSKSISEEGK